MSLLQKRNLKQTLERMRMLETSLRNDYEPDFVSDSDFQNFIENLQIITKQQGRQPLIMNRDQERIWHWYLEMREKKIPARGICLKARRLGVSTLIEAIIFADALMRPFRASQVVAHDWKSSLYLFGMAKRFWQYLPIVWKRKRPLASNTNRKLQWAAPHDSWLAVASANNPGLGSGELIHNLHWSEHAKCANPPLNDSQVSIMQCVPPSWNTLVFIESTAFGAYNLFHQMWLAAEAGKNDFTPLFLTWKGFPEYSLPTYQERQKTDLEYQKLHDLTDYELNWWIWKKKNDCRNDEQEVKQEYPCTADEAFKSSGTPWFHSDGISFLRRNLDKGVNEVGYLNFISDMDPVVEFRINDDGPTTIFEHPVPDVHYCLGADVAEGVGGDFSVCQVLRSPNKVGESIQQVAMFTSNRVPAEQFGVEIYKLATYYNRGYVGVEKNNQGLTSLSVLEHGHASFPQMRKGYPNMYYHTPIDRKTKEQTPRLGWITTSTTKQLMLGHFQQVVLDGELVLGSPVTLNEMAGLNFNSQRGQWVQMLVDERTKLAHDDHIISMAIGLMMVIYAREHRSFGRARDGGW